MKKIEELVGQVEAADPEEAKMVASCMLVLCSILDKRGDTHNLCSLAVINGYEYEMTITRKQV